MSIYGPELPSTAEPAPDNRALKARLDAQVGLRVLKAGDTMTGELQMGGNMIRGLPQVYPPSDYLGDEAISWSQVVRLTREALEAWEPSPSPIEPSRKPLITVWAEENGPLDGGYEWSFGNGCHQHASLGYPMPTTGRIKSMTLCIVPARVPARVGLVVNGRDVPEYVVSKSASQRAGIVSWSEGYELAPGDTITFKTIWTDDEERASGAIVSTLIELDIWWNMHCEESNCTRNGRKPLSSSPLCRPGWQWQYPMGSVLSAPGDLTIEPTSRRWER